MADRLETLRAKNGGPFTRAEAVSAGFTELEVRGHLRDGDWVRPRRGVYLEASLAASVADDPQRRHALDVASLLLALAFPARAATVSAAQILGLEFLSPPPPGLVVVSSDPAVRGVRRDGYLVRAAGLPEHHCRKRHGVPITSAARTLFDLASELPFKDAVVLADSALRLGLASAHQLREVLCDCSGWPGSRAAQDVLSFADRLSGSVLESISRVAFREAGIPAPRTQAWIGDEEGSFAQVDFRSGGKATRGTAHRRI